jgi:hypothetical protein
MDNNDPKKNVEDERKKETESLDENSHGKTNAQLAAEAMTRLARGEASALDIIILQRYLLKKPS